MLNSMLLLENLTNWVLTEDGDQFAFVLRAGTAGLTADEISEMVRGLRNAGMSPAEIGEAIAAASSRDDASADNGVDMVETPRTQIVRDYLEVVNNSGLKSEACNSVYHF